MTANLPLDLSRQTFPRSVVFPSYDIRSGSGFPRNNPSLYGGIVSPYSSLNTNGYGMDDVGYDTITSKKRITSFSGTKEELQSSLDFGSLMFGMVLPRTVTRYMNAGNAGLMHDMPMIGKSLSDLNLYLKSEAGRIKYGGQTEAKELVDDWQYQGHQLTDFTNDTKLSGEMAVTTGIDGRARIPDIFQAGGQRSARVMDTCYLVWVRRSLPGASDMDVAPDSKSSATEAPRTYWEIVPLCMPGNTYVPCEWYTGYDPGSRGQIRGHCRCLGTLTDVFRTGGDTCRLTKLAREAVFPTSTNADTARKAMMELGHVELQMKMNSPSFL